jgi:uncharacterized Tic20 family protein
LQLLTRFKNAGPNFVLISFAGTKFALAIIAQVFSASLIWVTLKSKYGELFKKSKNILNFKIHELVI